MGCAASTNTDEVYRPASGGQRGGAGDGQGAGDGEGGGAGDWRELKLLLLGAQGAGKSTLVKQLHIIFGGGFSHEAERALYTPLARAHALRALETALRLDEGRGAGAGDGDSDARRSAEPLLSGAAAAGGPRVALALARELLQHDAAVQRCVWRALLDPRLALADPSAPYFLRALPRVARPDYVPSPADVLRCHDEAEAGAEAAERVFEAGPASGEAAGRRLRLRVLELGAKPPRERAALVRCFAGADAALFCASLSDYDSPRRLRDAMALFRLLCRSSWLAPGAVLLFLNKKDVFRDKVQRTPITVCFPEYTGSNTYLEASAYIRDRFEALIKHGVDCNRYTHFTCAIDTANVRTVINDVIDFISTDNINEYIYY